VTCTARGECETAACNAGACTYTPLPAQSACPSDPMPCDKVCDGTNYTCQQE
jgi:hypothetical protein